MCGKITYACCMYVIGKVTYVAYVTVAPCNKRTKIYNIHFVRAPARDVLEARAGSANTIGLQAEDALLVNVNSPQWP